MFPSEVSFSTECARSGHLIERVTSAIDILTHSGRDTHRTQLIAEFFIVFVGVAIALPADDWREDREERNRELAYLLAIDADMKSASDVLETALSDNNEFARNSSAALAVLRSTEPPSPESTAKFNLGLNFSVSEPAVPIGTIRALLESGELSIILSDELRATLISELAEIERNLS